MPFWKAMDATARRIVGLGVLVCVLIVLALTLAWCNSGREAAKAKASAAMSDSRTVSAGEASDVRDTVEGQTDAIKENVETGTNEIRNAPDDASRNSAAIRSLCRVNPSASPDCRLLATGPR